MRFNFNKILNEKHALKVFSRGTKDNNLIVDLNNKVSLGLNLPKNQIYPQMSLEKKQVSAINPALTWRLASRVINNSLNSSFLDKPLIDVSLANSLFYRRSYIRKKRSLLLYRDGLKGGLRSVSVRTRFLRFCRSTLNNSSVSTKLYYLNLHKDTSLMFQRPRVSCVNSKLYTIFDRKTKSFRKHFSLNFKALSNSFLYSSLYKNFQKRVLLKNNKKLFSKVLTELENRKFLFSSQVKGFDAKKNVLTLSILKNLNSKSNSINSRITETNTFNTNSSSLKFLLENYLQLNETNKEKIKKAIETANIEFIKSDLFKIRAEQFGKYTANHKFARTKRSKKFYKGKSQDFIRSNSKSAADIFKRLQTRVFSKSPKLTTDKSKFNKKSNIRFKFSSKVKKSKS